MKHSLKKKNILVIGDIMLDEYVRGDVVRISPEAPVPVLSNYQKEFKLGGCANVAKNLTSLGANAWIMGRIGHDKQGTVVKHLLAKERIFTDLLIEDTNTVTTTKTRFISGNQHLLRVDKEKIIFDKFKLDVIKADLKRHLHLFDAIIVSDYNKGMIDVELAKYLGDLCLEYNKVIIADTKKTDIRCFENYTSLTPNLKELENIIKHKINNYKESFSVAKELVKSLKLKNILITLSENGLYVTNNKEDYHLLAEKSEIVDVTGCGDTVIAVFTLSLINDFSIQESAKIANVAAGVVALKSGAETCSSEELLKHF